MWCEKQQKFIYSKHPKQSLIHIKVKRKANQLNWGLEGSFKYSRVIVIDKMFSVTLASGLKYK